jgi:hypothetical protein
MKNQTALQIDNCLCLLWNLSMLTINTSKNNI